MRNGSFVLLGVLSFGSAFAACSSDSDPPGGRPDSGTSQDATTDSPSDAGDKTAIDVTGFTTPESALYDSETDTYLVSNVTGDPTVADHNGFISRVSPDGTITSLRFIEGAGGAGLSAPKGMALASRVLYVTDIDRVRSYDADTGAVKADIPIPGSLFLNDATSAPDGTVYVTDTGDLEPKPDAGSDAGPADTGAVYKIKDGVVQKVSNTSALASPNGILYNDGKLEIVTFSAKKWLTFDPAGGSILRQTELPSGQLDGIVRLEDGSFVISSWAERGVLYRVPTDKPAEILGRNLDSPADLGYDTKRRRILLPIMLKDLVRIIPL